MHLKMIKLLSYISFCIAIFYHHQAAAQFVKYSNDFLSIGVGADALGKSNAVIGTVSNVTSAYWNPAGLASIGSRYQAELMHNEYFSGIAKYDYFGSSYKSDSSTVLAFSLMRFGVDDIPNTIDLMDDEGNFDYSRLSRFSVADYAFLFSYAKKTNIPCLNYGLNAKLIYRNLGKFAKAYGFGIDAGLQYRRKNLFLGVMARDISNTFNVWKFNEEELLIETTDSSFNYAPENSLEITLPGLVLGAAYGFELSKLFKMRTELNLKIGFDGRRNVLLQTDLATIDPAVGIEFDYINLAFLRFGLGNIQKISNFEGDNYVVAPSMGLGVKYLGLEINYALSNIGNSNGLRYSNVFSLRYSFNGF